jgi:hypothetical protein
MDAIPVSSAATIPDNRAPAREFYVPTALLATAGRMLGPTRARLLDFRHRLAFFTPAREQNRSAT